MLSKHVYNIKSFYIDNFHSPNRALVTTNDKQIYINRLSEKFFILVIWIIQNELSIYHYFGNYENLLILGMSIHTAP